MAVRFLPVAGEPAEPSPERDDLAEVIELRSLLVQFEASPPAADHGHADSGPAEQGTADQDAEARGAGIPRDEATRLLARRAMSGGELREALLMRGHEQAGVDDVIAEFERSLYLDDAGLARSTAEKLRSAKRASRSQIRVKLRERRLSDEIIEAVLSELSDDEELALLRAAAEERARRLSGLDRQTAQRRLLGYLQRRGWQGEAAYRIVNEVLAS